MAVPSRIAETITKFGKCIDNLKTIVVADAERWDDLLTIMPGLIEEQITEADIVLLNKIDCLELEQVSEVEESIRSINSSALYYAISAHAEVDPQIWRKAVTNCV